MPAGRPTKYKPEYCEEIVDYSKTATYPTMYGFAAHLEVSHDTIFEWVKVYPEFSESVKVAQSIIAARQLERMHNCAITGEGNATAMIFITKNQVDTWKDKADLNLGGQKDNPIKSESVVLHDINAASQAYELLIKGK